MEVIFVGSLPVDVPPESHEVCNGYYKLHITIPHQYDASKWALGVAQAPCNER